MKIELKDVTKQYRSAERVVTSLNLTVDDGEICAILGEQGSGKTTLMKLIAGILKPDSGEVLMDGKKAEVKTDDVIMLFDDGALIKGYTVFDNLAYPLKIRGFSKEEIALNVLRAAEMMEIKPLLELRPKQLDAAERVRVSMTRLFLRDCKVVLVDNPLDGLDMFSRRELWQILSKNLKMSGKTVVFSTTYASEAASISDKIVVLNNCVVKQIGSARQMRNTPQSICVAKFFDDSFSTITAFLSKRGGEPTLKFECGYELNVGDISARLISDAYYGKNVTVGFRSGDIDLIAADSTGKVGAITSKVAFAQNCITDWLLELENGQKIRVSEYGGEKEVSYTLDQFKIFLFDYENENSILK